MLYEVNELASAILFFEANDVAVSHQMVMPEFEAVLAKYVALEELAGRTYACAYAEFDSRYRVHRVVFFTISINDIGYVESDWYLPLANVAAAAEKNEGMDGHSIRVACRSHSPVSHYTHLLWDPCLDHDKNHLSSIKFAIEQNKLGIAFKALDEQNPHPDSAFDQHALITQLRKEYAQEYRDHVDQLLKEQRLHISTVVEDADQRTQEIQLEHQRQTEALQARISELEEALASEQNLNANLKKTEKSRMGTLEAIRAYYEEKLRASESSESALTEAHVSAIETELNTKHAQEQQLLKDSLQTKEVELLYRDELESKLHDEITRLKDQLSIATKNTGEQLLQQLIESGVSLVSFQPGAGHLTIPLNEVSDYLSNPLAYTASKCHVAVKRYSQWLEHYRMPVCVAIDERGIECGANIDRIEKPIDFISGESNLCQNCRNNKVRRHLKIAGS